MDFQLPPLDELLRALGPYAWVIAGTLATLFLAFAPFIGNKWTGLLLSLATVGAGIFFSVQSLYQPAQSLFSGMMLVDGYAHAFNLIFLVSAAVTIMSSFRYLDAEGIQHREYNILILFALIGMMMMSSATNLIVLFIALEIMSLTVYTLVGFRRADRKSNEAALKYFILGGAASAILLYGSALLYGASGSLNIKTILEFAQSRGQEPSLLFALGAALVLIGFLFKVASVPFHMWMPDVYEGAPAPITGFMTTGLKAAAFAAFVRVFMSFGMGKGLTEAIVSNIHHVLWICAVLTMLIGNVIALTQTNLKRMLAYSSIAHTGYLLVGIVAGYQSEEGFSPILVYLASYTVMNLGAFLVLTVMASRASTPGDQGLNLQDLSGMARKSPWLSFAMAVFILSMAGIPGTAGFIGKYLLFYSAIQAGETVLVVLSVLCSAISVYYYLRVLVFMYMREPQGREGSNSIAFGPALALACMVVLTLQVGILPSGVLRLVKDVMAGM